MEIQLQELIDKIKREGIEAASADAARVKKDAQAEAEAIVAAARKEAAELTSRGQEDAARFEKAAVAALEQASRNLVLAFKAEIQALLDRIVARETAAAFDEDTLKAALPDILKRWAADGGVDVILPEAELAKLGAFFDKKLAAELKAGVELKSDRNLASGFRVAGKDGSAYYDFSAESAAELLSAYLNPRLAEILKGAAAGGR